MPEADVLQTYSVEEFLSPATLNRADAAVMEIFRVMFGLEIEAMETTQLTPSLFAPNELTAVVGFSGAMRGSCHIRVTMGAAKAIASAMLGGAPIEEGDDSINDAVGELCNMLAGGWKNDLRGLSSECALSPPTVISGQNYKVHLSKPSVSLTRHYRFDGHYLHLMLCCEEIEAPEEIGLR